jgi:hypothetical protein
MKKGILIVLALLLAMPAISFAGSATSRWDLTVGGQVKMTVGYADWVTGDQRAGGTAPRGDRSGFSTINNKYGTQIWSGGETGLNFAVRGPDTMGAKTSAFISGDFVGTWGGSTWGTFDLVVATMTFDWANDTLTLGMGGGFWGMMPTFGGMGWSDYGGGYKGAAPVNPGIKLTHRFGKNIAANFIVSSPRDSNSGPNASATAPANQTDQDNVGNSNLRSSWPLLGAGIQYSSDACGRVGPWMLTFKADGLFTQEKKFYNDTLNTVNDKDLNATYFDFVVLVPIIPEKNGNKTGALYVDGAFYNSQNFGSTGYLGGFGAVNSYTRSLGEFSAPHQLGYVGHFQYYFTDAFSFNGGYGYSKNYTSSVYRNANPNTLLKQEFYLAQLQWQASPAVKFQFLYDHDNSKYMGPGTAAQKQSGVTNTYRMSAFYYF